MSRPGRHQLLQTKDIDALVEETQVEGKRLKRSLGPWSLIAFGIGAVIGGGIFTVTGTAAAGQHLSVPSILNAPLLDLILHGGHAASMMGRPGAGPGLRFPLFWSRSLADLRRFATRNWLR